MADKDKAAADKTTKAPAESKGMEPSSNNDQLIRTVPGTDIGGHDTAGVDGDKRTERPGELLGTPNPSAESVRNTQTHRAAEEARADRVTKAVDKANREELPKLGGETNPETGESVNAEG
jgi:hypothetical protein